MSHRRSHFALLFLGISAIFAVLPAWATDRVVSNKTQLTAACLLAQPGDNIVWKNGTYDNLSSITFEPTNWGTVSQPITLKAETPGGVTFRGDSQLNIGGHWLVVSGFRFDNSAFTFTNTTTAIAIINYRAHSTLTRHAYNTRVTDCTFVSYDNPATATSAKWIEMYGGTNRFDHNYVSNKVTMGALLIVELSDTTNNIGAAHQIDHNAFLHRPPGAGANEYETVRTGTSSYSDQFANITVASNYFWRCSGEAEFVSNKSCGNSYLYNTFVECAGSLCLRHGSNCRVEGNVFLGNYQTNTGGIRVVNQNHVVINNYLQDLAGTDYQAALAIMDGTNPATNSNPDLSGSYVTVSNVVIAHNTIVHAADAVNYGEGKGGSGRTVAPRNFTMAANLIVTTNAPIFSLTDTPVNVTNLDNIIYGATPGITTNSELLVINPLLVVDSRGFYRPASNSPALNAAATQTLLNTNVLDMDGELRTLANRDIGADEYNLGTRPPAPLSVSEVGPTWMQPVVPKVSHGFSGGSFSITWPTNNSSGFQLESATNLPAGTWTVVGSVSNVAANYQVTQSVAGKTRMYFRLRKP